MGNTKSTRVGSHGEHENTRVGVQSAFVFHLLQVGILLTSDFTDDFIQGLVRQDQAADAPGGYLVVHFLCLLRALLRLQRRQAAEAQGRKIKP